MADTQAEQVARSNRDQSIGVFFDALAGLVKQCTELVDMIIERERPNAKANEKLNKPNVFMS